ncbi:MAG: acetyl-CoA carboxylase biotin carboxyl carrier protein subunit [Pseudomonadota bacterium]
MGVSIDDPLERTVEDTGEAAAALAPMHGRLVHLFVKEGDVVEKDTPLFAVEAMKMEHTVKAGGPAIVSAVHYVVGEQVGEGAEVIALGSADETAPDAASAGAAGAQPEEAATETPAVAAPDAGEPAPSPPAADT